MKRYFILLLLLFTACAQGTDISHDPRVEQFLSIYPGAERSFEQYGPHDQEFITEFLAQECAIDPPFARITYKQYGARLIAYVKDSNISCMITKIEPAPIEVVQGNPANAPEGVALLVNGEPIMFEQVQAAYASLPQEQQTVESIATIINALVTQELLRQEAADYEVDVNAAYDALIAQSNLSREAFAARLAEQNVSEAALRSQLEQQLKVQALLEDKLGPIDVDDESARAFYLENTDSFIVSEQTTFQHILVSAEGKSPEAIAQRTNTVLRSLNNTDFCTVVKTYSDDAQSIDRCGVYTIPRGVVQPQIEQAAFSTPPGQLTVTETQAGIHFINVLEHRPTRVVRYDEIQNDVRSFLSGQVQQLRLNAYIATLEADVVSYLTIQR